MTDTAEQKALAAPTKTAILDSVESDSAMEPSTLGGMYRLAGILSTSKLVPDHFKSDPASTMLVMMQAKSLGLPLVPALQNSYVIGGKVGWYAVVLETLAKRSPRCKKFYLKSSDDKRAVCVVQTTDMDEPVEVSYTIEEAKRAGLTGRTGGGYDKNPSDMLTARVRTRASRQYFPEAILGMFSVEELQETVPKTVGPRKSGAKVLEMIAAEEEPGEVIPEAEVMENEGAPPVPEEEPAPPPAAPPENLFSRPDLETELLEAARKMIGKSGPTLLRAFVQQRFKKRITELAEKEIDQVETFLKEQAEGATA